MSPTCSPAASSRLTLHVPLPPAEAPPVVAFAAPEWTHDGATPEVRELLEALDDAMFAAIAGNVGALEKARALWAETVPALPWELVDESREQYLRYAAEMTRRAETNEQRSPDAAIAALEVLQLLTSEPTGVA